MSGMDHVYCVIASLFGAVVSPLIRKVTAPWMFVISTFIGAGTSICFTHFALEWMRSSGYLPGVTWGDTASCVATAAFLGLIGERTCMAVLSGIDQRGCWLGRLIGWLFGGTNADPPRAHRPDSDLQNGMGTPK